MIDSINRIKSPFFFKNAIRNKIESSGRRRRQRNNNYSAPARRMVSFSESGNDRDVAISVHSIPSLSDMSQQEIRDTWYNEREFKIMRLVAKRFLKNFLLGNIAETDDDEGIGDCAESQLRGLETKTPQGARIRKQNRIAAMDVVLDEQDTRRDQGMVADPEVIALLYRACSEHCRLKAIETAANDEKWAKEQHGCRRRRASLDSDDEASATSTASSASAEPGSEHFTRTSEGTTSTTSRAIVAQKAKLHEARSRRRILSRVSRRYAKTAPSPTSQWQDLHRAESMYDWRQQVQSQTTMDCQ